MYKFCFFWNNIFLSKLENYTLFSNLLFDQKTNKQDNTDFQTSVIS